jgi:hypothetical protein
MKRLLVLTATLLAFVSACNKEQGREGGPCFPNGTCDDGLACTNETCVNAGNSGDCAETVEVNWAAPETSTPAAVGDELCGDAWHAFEERDSCAYPPDDGYVVACPSNGLTAGCTDCGAEDCVTTDTQGLDEEPTCFCLRQCQTEADCVAGERCMCSLRVSVPGGTLSGPPQCVGGCRSDVECGDGERCLASVFAPTIEFHCTSQEDECDPTQDCPASGPPVCLFDTTLGHWACTDATSG